MDLGFVVVVVALLALAWCCLFVARLLGEDVTRAPERPDPPGHVRVIPPPYDQDADA